MEFHGEELMCIRGIYNTVAFIYLNVIYTAPMRTIEQLEIIQYVNLRIVEF